ncbi:MAG: zinc ribbon domain-containing protein [Massilioclostridium sp.]|nr:zinc ribbon domain-containing protein [Massilioclostridium sp.]
MALIICPECGKEVSNQAKTCPNCGYSMNTSTLKSKSYKKRILISIFSLAIIILIILVFILINQKQKEFTFRQVNLGMTQQQVIIAEDQLDDSKNGSPYSPNCYIYKTATNYSLSGSMLYRFDDNDELSSIFCNFPYNSHNSDTLLTELKNEYGKPDTEEQDLGELIISWKRGGNIITYQSADSDSPFGSHLSVTIEKEN